MLLSRMLLGVSFGLAAALLAALLGLTPFAQTMEMKAYDWRVRRTATAATEDSIVLVNIDDDSVKRMDPLVGRWPWPRFIHAALIDYLAAGGAKAIVYDVLFTEGDQRRFTVGDTEWTGAESDQALVDATASAGMVIMAAEAASSELLDPSRAVPVALDGIPALEQRYDVDGCVERRPQITPPFPALAHAARGLGHSFVVYDADGPIRRVVPFVRVAAANQSERAVPSLPLAAVMLADGLEPQAVGVDETALRVGDRRVPLVTEMVPDYYGPPAPACRALLSWHGPTRRSDGTPSFRAFSFYDLFYAEQQRLEGVTPDVDPSLFKDRIVVVGVTAQGIPDVFTTPFAEGRMPGAEIHANAIDAWRRGRTLTPAGAGVALAITAAVAVGLGALGAFVSAWATGGLALVVIAGYVLFNVRAFSGGTWWPLVVPITAATLAFVADLAWHYFVEGREKRQVKQLFSRYVAKDVYDQLLADPTRAKLGGTRRHMTVLFSDMRGFTALTEKGAPEDIVAQLNDYFTRMVKVLFEHHGTLDKFVGDMVMALFGAPLDDEDHAEHAVQAALAMVRALDVLNAEWESFGQPRLDIGIGINTGDMVAGNIGSDTIMSYTVIGDAVNLGARLESLNKDYGTRIIISEATRALLKAQYDIRPLGSVTVKGKSQPVAIYEVRP
ncbi:MAG: adenylate/guanylate cyclase domain-containing protein [Acidobacteria bacterium]|nr:adenylate/guanylate cyclase domain-containing protein [Acidobacteriota bacterium]